MDLFSATIKSKLKKIFFYSQYMSDFLVNHRVAAITPLTLCVCVSYVIVCVCCLHFKMDIGKIMYIVHYT